MANVYKTANGRQIDVDRIRLNNEEVIAVGNLRVNARGDQLGAGGKIVKTRDQLMKEYYALNTPVAQDDQVIIKQPVSEPQVTKPAPRPATAPPVVQPEPEPIVYSEAAGMDPDDFLPEPQTPVAVTAPAPAPAPKLVADPIISAPPQVIEQVAANPAPVVEPTPAPAAKITSPITATPSTQPAKAPLIRGSLASAVAKKTKVEQVEKLPLNKANGVQRF